MRAWTLSPGLLAASLSVGAGEWEFTPRLSLQETYTDNVLLTETGAEGDFVSAVTPGISLHGQSPRVRSDIDYNLNQLYYGDKTEFNSTNHQLQANTEATLVKEWLFFDMQSRMSQQNIDNRGQITQNNRGNGANLRDVRSFEIAPRVEHRFGSWVNLLMRYSNQTVDQSGTQQSNEFVQNGSSDEEGYLFDLSSGPRFGRFPLRLTLESREAEFDTGQKNEFKSITGEGSYVWSRKFRLTATGGNEDNQYDSSQGSTDGLFWTMGGTWTPTPRTTVSGNWGDRFYGKTWNINANHRHRRLVFSANYNEDVRTSNQYERDLILVPLFDVNGLPVFDPVTSGQILVPIDSPSLTDDVFIERRINFSLNYQMRRSDWRLNFFQYDRESQSSGNDELTRGVTFNASHSIRPRLTVNFGSTWRQDESSGDDSSGTFYSVYPSMSYELGPHTSARLQYEYTYNDGAIGTGGSDLGGGGFGGGFGGNENGASEYTENAISASLVFHL